MASIGNRLDRAMIRAGFKSQSELHRASGVPQSTINRILKHSVTPSTDILVKLATACEVSFEWLAVGSGVMYQAAVTDEDIVHNYPVLTRDQLADLSASLDAVRNVPEMAQWVRLSITLGPNGFMYQLDNRTMMSHGRDDMSFAVGEFICCNPDVVPKLGSFVIAKLAESNRIVFRRYTEIEGDLYLEALSPDAPNRLIQKKPWDAIVAVATAAFKPLPT